MLPAGVWCLSCDRGALGPEFWGLPLGDFRSRTRRTPRALWGRGMLPVWKTGKTLTLKRGASCTHCGRRVRPEGPSPTLPFHKQTNRKLSTTQRQR
ncbi:hypothetical protein NDU88_003758 [Pleurodeles waltl]|uniref:Uncharacterized protein n=1 Tax=Pleurodeles waltl TaxID=8319 RepID=A0AAV7T699_PLEWA|nr:hypothetical protein NDU88_003758 [Pleurodeles waltl]